MPARSTSRLDSTNGSSHFTTRENRVLQTTPDLIPDGLPTLRLDCNLLPGLRHSNEYFLRLCQPLRGFQDCHVTTYVHRTSRAVLQVAKVEFDTRANATRGAGLLTIIGVDHPPYSVSYFPDSTDSDSQEVRSEFEILSDLRDLSSLAVMEEDATNQPARKKAKLTLPIVCRICTNGITGPYSKPCLRCKKPWCLECVKTWFIMATKDFERMPARCCNNVMHHGVAGGTLSTGEYEQYKLRYDEQTTANPLYCPIPTCSTFIPPRLIDSTQGTVNCTLCTARICTKCKQLAATDHICEEEAATVQIKALKYKICPKCGTAVMKMYGCPHIRCVCGAHLCWDCMRALAVCYRSPCASAIEDGQYGDEGSDDFTDSEDDSENAGTIMGIASDTREVDPISTTNAQVEIAGTRNAVQAMLNVFRGRRRRGPGFEERREVFRTVAQPPLPLIAPETTPESATVPIVASENLSPLETPASATSTASIPASTIPPILATPLEFGNPTVLNELEEPVIFSSVQDERHDSPESLCLMESRNTTPPNFLMRELPGQEAPLPDIATPVAADSADTPAPMGPACLAVDPLAAALPFASSSNTDLHESDSSTRPNPAIFPQIPIIEQPSNPNLDDPDLRNWEAEDYDFGDEPNDEAFDVWGCVCTFTILKKDAVDEHWMDLKYLDCMKCFGEMILFPAVGGGEVRRSEKEKFAWHCFKCGVVVCGRCVRDKKRWMRGLIKANGREGEGVE
jgi:hypothetical protein